MDTPTTRGLVATGTLKLDVYHGINFSSRALHHTDFGVTWQQLQAIYQIITDRFARGDGSNKRCTNFRRYCGGTFKGIEQHLDYIKGMGFTAIWMSPISEQTRGLTW